MTFISGMLALAAIAVALVIRKVISDIRFNRKYRFPPSPPGKPFVGNMLDVPWPAGMWGVDLAKKYGEMFTIRIGNKNVVYLNSSRVVTDLLEKRASIYASRPDRPMAQDIASGGVRMLFMGHTNQWRNQRKIMHNILNSQQAETKFVKYQELESRQLIWDYLKDPEHWYNANQRFSNSVIMGVVFGRRAALDDKVLTKMLKQMIEIGSLAFRPSLRSAADFVPWLNYLPKPLQWWRSYGEDLFKRTLDIYKQEVDAYIVKMKNGQANPCFAADIIQGTAKKEFILGEHEKLMVFSTLLEAGSDTSRTATTQMCAAAAVYPEWVKTTQALLDEVCGHNAERLPMLSDREKLPYITAVVKEALRWRPFVQTGVPHELTQDDEYEGYRFPKGTLFTWNAYAIALDEKEYKNAHRFLPERWLDSPDLKNPLKGHWSFGAVGRRVCVGYNVGFNNVWIATACLLYCYNFEQDPDHPIDTYNSMWDSVDRPPFKLRVKPRSQAHIELIEREGLKALNTVY
ncbi:uncharacterized protein A1O5_12540 [Cladophialophora psammophila CBS 110553]|uniref:Cytochrome P450 oxidoreductase n=1 Tax=Cladophialophora psammophila CBS 110553 TaxID=1182543 RepID=W9VYE9_9EURO|nr:uncharacterized protein A1O5_12540 [Cladophialophora psammophila CBS 110553]EXJ57750.1 hypothetical protein A1O5_12540 [Cladophialophora psammophila CBS 110553]